MPPTFPLFPIYAGPAFISYLFPLHSEDYDRADNKRHQDEGSTKTSPSPAESHEKLAETMEQDNSAFAENEKPRQTLKLPC
jgi:hypothetical protein